MVLAGKSTKHEKVEINNLSETVKTVSSTTNQDFKKCLDLSGFDRF